MQRGLLAVARAVFRTVGPTPQDTGEPEVGGIADAGGAECV